MDSVIAPKDETSRASDTEAVAAMLGRRPSGNFRVVLRRPGGSPVVIENEPFLDDGSPMPTLFWLVDPALREVVSGLEASGGVRRAQAAVDPDELEASHARYARLRDAKVEPSHLGPRPSGGVGGTRRGVKCLHAHLAWHLVDGQDPVGSWVVEELSRSRIDQQLCAIVSTSS